MRWLFEHDDEDSAGLPAAGALAGSVAPGSVLAGLLEGQAPDGLDDAGLVESAGGWRRLASWATARELGAVAELARRRPSRRWDHSRDPEDPDGGPAPVLVSREAVEEVSLALTLTYYSAGAWTHLAVRLARRLPATLAALRAGTIDLYRARLFDDATETLEDKAAWAVEDAVLPDAGEMTSGELREALRRASIKVDPDAADRRREQAERRARVGLYGDPDGTATLAGQNLPGVLAAAALARITAIARGMKAAGTVGGIDLLRAQAFTGLLLGNLPLIPPPADSPDGPAHPGPAHPGDGPAGRPGGSMPSGSPGAPPGNSDPDGPDGLEDAPGRDGECCARDADVSADPDGPGPGGLREPNVPSGDQPREASGDEGSRNESISEGNGVSDAGRPFGRDTSILPA